jgi:hypothetical protein
MLEEGVYATIDDLANAKGIGIPTSARFCGSPLLAPELVEAILDGRQPAELLEGFRWSGKVSSPVFDALRN